MWCCHDLSLLARMISCVDLQRPESRQSSTVLESWAVHVSRPIRIGSGGVKVEDLSISPDCKQSGCPATRPLVGVQNHGNKLTSILFRRFLHQIRRIAHTGSRGSHECGARHQADHPHSRQSPAVTCTFNIPWIDLSSDFHSSTSILCASLTRHFVW